MTLSYPDFILMTFHLSLTEKSAAEIIWVVRNLITRYLRNNAVQVTEGGSFNASLPKETLKLSLGIHDSFHVIDDLADIFGLGEQQYLRISFTYAEFLELRNEI